MNKNDIPIFVKDPLTKRIILEIGSNEVMSLDALMLKLKNDDRQIVRERLNELNGLKITKQPSPSLQNPDELFHLTAKGHKILIQMVASPELYEVDGEKPKPKWFNAYWVALFASTIVIVGFVIPYFSHQPSGKATIYLVFALLIIGFGFFIRVKPTSLKTNRLIYIVLIGGALGCFFSLFSLIALSRMGFREVNAGVILVFIGCFAVGGLIGDRIGKFRNYKGPQQYSF